MQAKAHGRWELMVAPHLAQSFSAISDATSGAMSPRWPLVRSPIWGGGGGLGGGRPRGRQGLAAVARCWLWWQRWWDGGSTHPSRPGFGAGGVLRGRAPGLGHGWWHCRSGWSWALGFAGGVVGWYRSWRHCGFGGWSGHLWGKLLGAHLRVPRDFFIRESRGAGYGGFGGWLFYRSVLAESDIRRRRKHP